MATPSRGGPGNLGPYRMLAAEFGCTYENVRTIQRHLVYLGHAQEVTA